MLAAKRTYTRKKKGSAPVRTQQVRVAKPGTQSPPVPSPPTTNTAIAPKKKRATKKRCLSNQHDFHGKIVGGFDPDPHQAAAHQHSELPRPLQETLPKIVPSSPDVPLRPQLHQPSPGLPFHSASPIPPSTPTPQSPSLKQMMLELKLHSDAVNGNRNICDEQAVNQPALEPSDEKQNVETLTPLVADCKPEPPGEKIPLPKPPIWATVGIKY